MTTTAKPATTAAPTTARPTTTTATIAPSTTAAVVYANCAAARAAGVTPLRRGSPGYSTDLDRDGDGVACES